MTRKDFAGQLVIGVHALLRTALLVTGLHFTRAGRKLYR